MRADLRYGRWQDVLQDVECDACIFDAPYSSKTHAGHDTSAGPSTNARDSQWAANGGKRRAINYGAFTPGDVHDFVVSWSERTRGWMVSITDDVLAPHWIASMRDAGRYVFAPLPLVETGSRVRLTGDGPSSWTCWVIVGRPKNLPYSKWGTLPGAYVAPSERKPVVGGKPIGLMRSIVSDYSRPGDLVCDPFAGGGTTLLAATLEGRRAVGAECLLEHYELARERLADAPTGTGKQAALFGGVDEP